MASKEAETPEGLINFIAKLLNFNKIKAYRNRFVHQATTVSCVFFFLLFPGHATLTPPRTIVLAIVILVRSLVVSRVYCCNSRTGLFKIIQGLRVGFGFGFGFSGFWAGV